MLFTAVTILIALVIVVYEFLTWNFDYWTKRNVPGPKPKLLLGNFPNMILGKKNVTYDQDEIYKKYKDQSTLVGVFAVHKPQVMVTDGGMVKDIFVKYFRNFSTNDLTDLIDQKANPLISLNPFFLKGEEWKDKRNEITPAFTVNRLKAGYPLIEDVCNRLSVYLNDHAEKELDVKELAAKYTTDVVSNMIFAMDAESFKSEKPVIREMGRQIFSNSFWLNAYFVLITAVPSISKIYSRPFVMKEVEDFFTGLMRDAIEYRKKNNITRVDYMEHLLQLQKTKSLSNLQMAEHSITFFLDGFETSSIFIAYVLFELSQNPDVQSKLREEISETKAKKGGLTYDTIAEMEYLDQVCNETLRLHPPAAFLAKKCTEDIELNYSKTQTKTVLIEKDMSVVIPLRSLQRDPEHYTCPETFNPDRFSAENGGAKYYKDKGVFFPFGDGPRICLGMRFALAQSKAAVVQVVDNFEILKSPKVQLPLTISPMEFMNVPVGGLWARFKPILSEWSG